MKKITKLALLSLIGLGLTSCSSTIKPGYVGIRINNFGGERGVQDYTLETGRVMYNPWTEEIYTFPVFVQNYVWTKDVNEGSTTDESITFNSVEGAVVNADVGVSFVFEREKVPQIFQEYRQTADEITATIIRAQVRDAINLVASKMKVTDIFGAGKEDLLNEVKTLLNQRLGSKGIQIQLITFVNALRVDKQVQNSINATLTAAQKAAEAENRLKQARTELEIAKINAQSNRVLSESITPQLLQKEALEKWNGQLPMSTSGMPFLDLQNNK
jgi:hypothetical protein